MKLSGWVLAMELENRSEQRLIYFTVGGIDGTVCLSTNM